MHDSSFIDGPKLQWERTGDPRWVWRMIRHCVVTGEPLPDWALLYLGRVAKAIENIEGDYGRELHRALEFPSTSGRKRANATDMQTEQFGMRFAKLVLDGMEAGKARTEAAAQTNAPKGDKELKGLLRGFFGLQELPGRGERENWQFIIVEWLFHHPGYVERYPDLPTTFKFTDSRDSPL